MNKNRLTPKMIRKAVKILEKHGVKPDGDGLITYEVEKPNELYDFLKNIKPAPRYMRDIKNITE